MMIAHSGAAVTSAGLAYIKTTHLGERPMGQQLNSQPLGLARGFETLPAEWHFG